MEMMHKALALARRANDRRTAALALAVLGNEVMVVADLEGGDAALPKRSAWPRQTAIGQRWRPCCSGRPISHVIRGNMQAQSRCYTASVTLAHGLRQD